MAWPDDTTLPIEVEAAFGADVRADPSTWSWTDLSARLLALPIVVRQDTASDGRMSPGTCTVTLNNDDGALTPLHPMSPYWPNVDLGTPLRVRVRWAKDDFARTGTDWGTAISGQKWTAVGGVPGDYPVAGGVARHSHTTANLLRRTDLGVNLLDGEQIIDVAPSAMLTGAALVTGLRFRVSPSGTDYYWLRAEFNSGGSSVMLKISRAVNNVHTELAVLNPVPGVAYAANTYLRVRASISGHRLTLKVWPATGPESAGQQISVTDDSAQAITVAGKVGAMSWLVVGNTNTLPVSALFKNYALRVDRFGGFADQWEPTFAPIGEVGNVASVVTVTASGITRRVTQGQQPLRSALYRSLMATNPTAYWPLEDPEESPSAASPIPGVGPMVTFGFSRFVAPFTGAPVPAAGLPEFGSGEGIPGSAPVIDLANGGTLRGLVPPGAGIGWRLEFVMVCPRDRASSRVPVRWITDGTWQTWDFQIEAAGIFSTFSIGDGLAGAAGNASESFTVFDGLPHHYRIDAIPTGSTTFARIFVDGIYVAQYQPFTQPMTGTPGRIREVIVNPLEEVNGTPSMPVIGHIAVWNAPPLANNTYEAMTGHFGEPAVDRLTRLCAEQGIPLDVVTVTDPIDTPMGPQRVATLNELIGECIEADFGLPYEQGFTMRYLPRAGRYNQPARLTIDLASYRVSGGRNVVLAPVLDDQNTRNRWTIERRDGGAAVVDDLVDQRRGVYGDSADLNLASDDDLPHHASWRLHLTTHTELREATFPVDLAANPSLIEGWLSCGIGSRIVRTNPPAQHGPGPIGRLVTGWTEALGPRSWAVQVTPEFATPWDVATADGPQRAPADGSTLAASMTSTATTFSLASTATNRPWTNDPAEFPQDVRVGGEQIRLSGITGAVSPQTAVIAARGLNGVQRSWPAGTPVDVCEPAIAPL